MISWYFILEILSESTAGVEKKIINYIFWSDLLMFQQNAVRFTIISFVLISTQY